MIEETVNLVVSDASSEATVRHLVTTHPLNVRTALANHMVYRSEISLKAEEGSKELLVQATEMCNSLMNFARIHPSGEFGGGGTLSGIAVVLSAPEDEEANEGTNEWLLQELHAANTGMQVVINELKSILPSDYDLAPSHHGRSS